MENIINFKDYGSHLSTRDLGQVVRKKILDDWTNCSKIIFNFEKVDVVTNSFADECFAKILDEKGLEVMVSKTTFINVNDFVNSSIILALKRKIK